MDVSYPGDESLQTSATFFATVEAILAHLTGLQHLRLHMRMYKSMCRQFKRLVDLKSIVWIVSRFIDDQGAGEDFRDEQQIAEEEFAVAFLEFAEKPSVAITIEEWPDDNDDW